MKCLLVGLLRVGTKFKKDYDSKSVYEVGPKENSESTYIHRRSKNGNVWVSIIKNTEYVYVIED